MAQGTGADGQTASSGQEKILENIPIYSQDDTSWCSWVSAQMVLSYYGYSVSPQAVAAKTFELAGQTWGGKDKDSLPWRYYKFYGDAIISSSNNNLVIEEINTQNKEDILYKIFEAIDRGYPIILLSGGPWLYDATDLPELSWIEFSPESSWPSGDHASVIVGYSLKEEMNNFITFGPLTFFTNLLDYPPVIKIHDPATAATGAGTYWVSYSKLFEKTIGYPSVTRLMIVKPKPEVNAGSGADGNPPTVQAFQVTPQGLTVGESFAIDYTVSDNGISGLKQVELWRKDEQSDWQEIKRDALSGGDGPASGSFTDAPSNAGKYWYGVHVADNAGNWNDEKNSNTDNQPGSYGPIEVEVIKVVSQGEESQQESVQEGSTSSSEWQYTGVVDAVQGNYDIAILCFDKAFELDPSFTLALYDKAVILNLQDKYDEAIYVCDKIIELDSGYGKAWNCKGYALLQQRRYDESIQALDKAIEIYPKYADAWHNKGEALQGLNRDTEASDAFAKADDLGYDGPTPIDFGRYWSSVN